MKNPDARVERIPGAGALDVYWCLYCGRALPIEEGGIVVHDDVPHPTSATYDEESKPQ